MGYWGHGVQTRFFFVRAFTYSFIKFLGMDLPRFGIQGDPYHISVIEKGFILVQGNKKTQQVELI